MSTCWTTGWNTLHPMRAEKNSGRTGVSYGTSGISPESRLFSTRRYAA